MFPCPVAIADRAALQLVGTLLLSQGARSSSSVESLVAALQRDVPKRTPPPCPLRRLAPPAALRMEAADQEEA